LKFTVKLKSQFDLIFLQYTSDFGIQYIHGRQRRPASVPGTISGKGKDIMTKATVTTTPAVRKNKGMISPSAKQASPKAPNAFTAFVASQPAEKDGSGGNCDGQSG
jgi:hypothetical protein